MSEDTELDVNNNAGDEIAEEMLDNVSGGTPGVQTGPIFVPFDNGGAVGG